MIRVREMMQKSRFHGVMAVEVVLNSLAAGSGIRALFYGSMPPVLRLPITDGWTTLMDARIPLPQVESSHETSRATQRMNTAEQ